MLVLISDLHLHDQTALFHNVTAKQFRDFWHNINRTRRQLLPLRKKNIPRIHLILLGDILDLIRSSEWNDPKNNNIKPWDGPCEEQKQVLSKIISRILRVNKDALDVLRKFAASKHVQISYMVGNHDHHLLRYPSLFNKVHEELGLAYPQDPKTINFYENFWPEYGVFAHHGDRNDPWNNTRGVLPPIGEALVTEVYNRFPQVVAKAVSGGDRLKRALEDLVYVRPYRVAPFYVIQTTRQYGEEEAVKNAWNQLIEEFLEMDHVKNWIQESRKISNFLNYARALKTTLRISHRLEFKRWLSVLRITHLIRTAFSVESPAIIQIRKQLQEIEDPRIRYLVNGHTHSPGVLALGKDKGHRIAYINTGTWTRTLLPDRLGPLEPADSPLMKFSPGDFISYSLFYTREENPACDMEFWSGRINPREN